LQLAQEKFCASNFWRDPHHNDKFLAEVAFLPEINNYVEHSNSSRFRANFARTPVVHFFGSPHDEVIMPWQSSLIGCASSIFEYSSVFLPLVINLYPQILEH
jgi:hypothetical protein